MCVCVRAHMCVCVGGGLIVHSKVAIYSAQIVYAERSTQ